MKLLKWIGNEVHNAEQAVGNAFHGAQQQAGNVVHAVQQAPQAAQQAVGHAVQGAEQAVQHVAAPIIQPISAEANNAVRAVSQHPIDTISQLTNPQQLLGRAAVQGAHNATSALNAVSHLPLAQKVGSVNLPVFGNLGQLAQGSVQSPIDAVSHIGQAMQGQNPYAGMSRPQAIGSATMDALNIGTLGKGKALADLGENIASKTAAKLGGGTLAKAAGKVVGTTAVTTPITGAFGGASVAQSGDGNLGHIAQGVATGAAAGPAIGLIHGAIPIAKAAPGAAKDLNTSLNHINDATKPQIDQGAATGGQGFLAGDKSKGGVQKEYSDASMKIKKTGAQALAQGKPVYGADVIDHKVLKDQYQHLFDKSNPASLKLISQDNIAHATIDKPNGVIRVPSGFTKNLNSPASRRMLTEEVQHAIDFHEGRSSGTTPAMEQMKAAPQEYQDAAKVAGVLKPQVDQMRSLVRKGNMTQDEFANHPITQRYQNSLGLQKSLQNKLISPAEATQRYLQNEGEIRARSVGERNNLTQDQIDANPIAQAPIPQTNELQPQFAASPINPDNEFKKAPMTEAKGATLPPNLHVGEPTPAALANLEDVASVGNALGKTKAYIKRVRDYAKANPAAKESLRQHLEALVNDQKALDARYGELKSPTNTAIGAKSQNVTPEQFAKEGLGMTDAQIAKAKKTDLSKTDNAIAKNVRKNGVAEPNARAGASKQSLSQIKRATRTAEDNTALNPIKKSIPEVQTGDYAKARSNAQLASNPVEIAGQQSLRAYDKLSKAEKTASRYMVEDPSLAKSGAAKEFVRRFRYFDDLSHATSQELGGNTFYKQNHFNRAWDLSDPKMAAKYEELAKQAGIDVSPGDFKGLNHQHEVFNSIKEGEAAGFKLKHVNPREDIQRQIKTNSFLLKRQAIVKGLTEADRANVDKVRSLDLGNGQVLPLSEQGAKEAKTYEINRLSENKIVKGYRKANSATKSTLLSLSQFHPINISVLRASPTLAMEGHPLMAAKGAVNTFRALNKNVADRIIETAQKDNMIDKAARIGMPYGASESGSTLGKATGEHIVFGQQMPAMHDQMARGVIRDLEQKGISLDSPEARAAGLAANKVMGFMNHEVNNVSPRVRQGMRDWLLASQFTPSKLGLVKDSLSKRGVAGSYARMGVTANVLATTMIAAGIGIAVKEKSDDIRDILLRALFDPAVPTSWIDAKGNNVKLRMPGTDTSDIAKLLGFKLGRGQGGHLTVNWHPGNMPSTIADYLRARLGIIPGDVVKLATNTNFAGKPLYDPNASFGAKVAQAGTTLATGGLPIGLQGLPMINGIKSHLPKDIQDVLNAQTPGSNPLLKSIGSSFGFTPSTDSTTGKALDSATYFNAINAAKNGLNAQEKAALQLYAGSKKNPVTGKYDVAPTVDDSRAKATALLQNPKVIDNLIAANQKVASQGGKVDPLWQQSKDNIVKYFQYQAMPLGSADRTDWNNKNQSWYKPLSQARNDFFNSLPPGDPNKPHAPIEYPTASPQVQNLMDAYFNAPDSKTRAQMIKDHPEIEAQFNKQDDYTNQMRVAQGYSANKSYPNATPQLQKFIDGYLGADKATRKGIRNSNPQAYQSMVAYFDSTDLYNIGKQASVNQLQGEPNTSSKELKSIQGISQDIYQNADGTYSLVPAGWMNGLSGGGSSSSSKTRVAKAKKPKAINYSKSIASTKAIGKLLGKSVVKVPKVSTVHTIKPPAIHVPKITQGKMPKAKKQLT